MAWGLGNYTEPDVIYLPGVQCTVTTGNFVTVFDRRITENHVVEQLEFAAPKNIASSQITCTTSDGKVVLNGKCTTATTVNITLIKSY